MNIAITGAGRAATAAAIKAVSTAFRVSIEEAEATIVYLEANEFHFIKASEAGERLRNALVACSHTPYREEEAEAPKKPVFFQRDIVPSRKRRFGTH